MAVKNIPRTDETPLLRTHFGDDAAWRSLCARVEATYGEFRAYVTPVDDAAFADLSLDEIVARAADASRSFILVADRVAQVEPDRAVLVVDLHEAPGRWFRVIPSQAWSVENNLSLANMGFEEFAEAVDLQGVFRGWELATVH